MIDLKKYIDRLQIQNDTDNTFIYDIIRKKNLVFQAEELIRQCILHYLIDELKFSKNHIKVEKGIKVNNLYKRCDIIVYDRNGNPILLVECKSPKVKVDQKVFNQIAMYNIPLQVPFLMVSNGDQTYFCEINFKNKSYEFLEELPTYEKIIENVNFDKNQL